WQPEPEPERRECDALGISVWLMGVPHRASSVSKSGSPKNSAEWHILKYADRPKAKSWKTPPTLAIGA
ncbi:hypothetical protein, partial [Xanthomonas nasturtii]|uniref:hypothetical protein n=1 Tax=Xanthomonas nasturtii TaxID=1843581 RepID=UPI002012595C